MWLHVSGLVALPKNWEQEPDGSVSLEKHPRLSEITFFGLKVQKCILYRYVCYKLIAGNRLFFSFAVPMLLQYGSAAAVALDQIRYLYSTLVVEARRIPGRASSKSGSKELFLLLLLLLLLLHNRARDGRTCSNA